MTVTRARFIRGAATLLLPGLWSMSGRGQEIIIPPRRPPRLPMQSAWLLAANEDADGGFADMSDLMTAQLSSAEAVAGLVQLVPADTFASARAAAARLLSPSPPSGFWNDLATAMVCAATASIPDNGINATINGQMARDRVRQLLYGDSGIQEINSLYAKRFWGRPVMGVPLITYLSDPGMVQELVSAAVSVNYMAELDLRATSDPDGPRKEAGLLLYKLMLAVQGAGSPDYRDKVKTVWSQRDKSSVVYLASTDSWPRTNFAAAFDVNNPFAGACNFLARIDRKEIRSGIFYSGTRTWHAEALATFISTQGKAAGLTTGANWNSYDDSDCHGCGITPGP